MASPWNIICLLFVGLAIAHVNGEEEYLSDKQAEAYMKVHPEVLDRFQYVPMSLVSNTHSFNQPEETKKDRAPPKPTQTSVNKGSVKASSKTAATKSGKNGNNGKSGQNKDVKKNGSSSPTRRNNQGPASSRRSASPPRRAGSGKN